MKLSVDKEADALYLRLDDSTIVESEEVSPGWCSITTNLTKSSAWNCSTSRNAPPN